MHHFHVYLVFTLHHDIIKIYVMALVLYKLFFFCFRALNITKVDLLSIFL